MDSSTLDLGNKYGMLINVLLEGILPNKKQ